MFTGLLVGWYKDPSGLVAILGAPPSKLPAKVLEPSALFITIAGLPGLAGGAGTGEPPRFIIPTSRIPAYGLALLLEL